MPKNLQHNFACLLFHCSWSKILKIKRIFKKNMNWSKRKINFWTVKYHWPKNKYVNWKKCCKWYVKWTPNIWNSKLSLLFVFILRAALPNGKYKNRKTNKNLDRPATSNLHEYHKYYLYAVIKWWMLAMVSCCWLSSIYLTLFPNIQWKNQIKVNRYVCCLICSFIHFSYQCIDSIHFDLRAH